MAERAARWQAEREKEAERKAEYMQNLKLPFNAEYGTHKAKQGDIFAVVVHTERFRVDSPFMVRFYAVKKAFGRLCAYECDADGNITKRHGRELRRGEIKGYRKVA